MLRSVPNRFTHKPSQRNVRNSRRENYDPALSTTAVVTDLEKKYNLFAGLTPQATVDPATGMLRNGIFDDIISSWNGRAGLYDLTNPVVIDPNVASDACATKWEKVPAYQAWDGTWYLEGDTPPACLAGMYGPNCDISCPADAGCAAGMSATDINNLLADYYTKQCLVQNNAQYCEYQTYNPPARNAFMVSRALRFTNQESAYQQTYADHMKIQNDRLTALDAATTKFQSDYEALKVQYEAEYTALVQQIADITAQIEDATKTLVATQTAMIAAKVQKIGDDAAPGIAELNDAKVALQTKVAELSATQVTLSQKIAADNVVLAGLRQKSANAAAAAEAAAKQAQVDAALKAAQDAAAAQAVANAAATSAAIQDATQAIKDANTAAQEQTQQAANQLQAEQQNKAEPTAPAPATSTSAAPRPATSTSSTAAPKPASSIVPAPKPATTAAQKPATSTALTVPSKSFMDRFFAFFASIFSIFGGSKSKFTPNRLIQTYTSSNNKSRSSSTNQFKVIQTKRTLAIKN